MNQRMINSTYLLYANAYPLHQKAVQFPGSHVLVLSIVPPSPKDFLAVFLPAAESSAATSVVATSATTAILSTD